MGPRKQIVARLDALGVSGIACCGLGFRVLGLQLQFTAVDGFVLGLLDCLE